MRGAGLQRPRVAHHRFDAVGIDSACKLLALALPNHDHRYCGLVLGKISINLEHLLRFRLRLFSRGVRSVPFLPIKLRRAQEQLRAQFPPHDAVPYVDQHRKIAIGFDPFCVHVPDDGLGGRPHDEWFLQLLPSADGHHRQLWGEALHMILFLLEEAHGDEQRKRGVHMAGRLEAAVESGRNVLPQSPTIRPDHHRAPYRSVVG